MNDEREYYNCVKNEFVETATSKQTTVSPDVYTFQILWMNQE